MDLVPPLRYGIVEESLFRGAYPLLRNFNFLRRLKIKTIISLIPEEPTKDLKSFCKTEGISHTWVEADRFKGEPQILHADLTTVLAVLLNVESYPVYIHCLDGRQTTGMCIMALRKVMGWDFQSMYDEFLRYSKEAGNELAFIVDFPADMPAPPKLPRWLWPSFEHGVTPSTKLPEFIGLEQEDKTASSGDGVASKAATQMQLCPLAPLPQTRLNPHFPFAAVPIPVVAKKKERKEDPTSGEGDGQQALPEGELVKDAPADNKEAECVKKTKSKDSKKETSPAAVRYTALPPSVLIQAPATYYQPPLDFLITDQATKARKHPLLRLSFPTQSRDQRLGLHLPWPKQHVAKTGPSSASGASSSNAAVVAGKEGGGSLSNSNGGGGQATPSLSSADAGAAAIPTLSNASFSGVGGVTSSAASSANGDGRCSPNNSSLRGTVATIAGQPATGIKSPTKGGGAENTNSGSGKNSTAGSQNSATGKDGGSVINGGIGAALASALRGAVPPPIISLSSDSKNGITISVPKAQPEKTDGVGPSSSPQDLQPFTVGRFFIDISDLQPIDIRHKEEECDPNKTNDRVVTAYTKAVDIATQGNPCADKQFMVNSADPPARVLDPSGVAAASAVLANFSDQVTAERGGAKRSIDSAVNAAVVATVKLQALCSEQGVSATAAWGFHSNHQHHRPSSPPTAGGGLFSANVSRGVSFRNGVPLRSARSTTASIVDATALGTNNNTSNNGSMRMFSAYPSMVNMTDASTKTNDAPLPYAAVIASAAFGGDDGSVQQRENSTLSNDDSIRAAAGSTGIPQLEAESVEERNDGFPASPVVDPTALNNASVNNTADANVVSSPTSATGAAAFPLFPANTNTVLGIQQGGWGIAASVSPQQPEGPCVQHPVAVHPTASTPIPSSPQRGVTPLAATTASAATSSVAVLSSLIPPPEAFICGLNVGIKSCLHMEDVGREKDRERERIRALTEGEGADANNATINNATMNGVAPSSAGKTTSDKSADNNKAHAIYKAHQEYFAAKASGSMLGGGGGVGVGGGGRQQLFSNISSSPASQYHHNHNSAAYYKALPAAATGYSSRTSCCDHLGTWKRLDCPESIFHLTLRTTMLFPEALRAAAEHERERQLGSGFGSATVKTVRELYPELGDGFRRGEVRTVTSPSKPSTPTTGRPTFPNSTAGGSLSAGRSGNSKPSSGKNKEAVPSPTSPGQSHSTISSLKQQQQPTAFTATTLASPSYLKPGAEDSWCSAHLSRAVPMFCHFRHTSSAARYFGVDDSEKQQYLKRSSSR